MTYREACGAIIGPEGESCGVPRPCAEHGRLCATTGARCVGPCPCATYAAARISILEGHRKQWRRIAFELLDLVERLGAMNDPDGTSYICSWCLSRSDDVGGVKHLHDCRLAGLLDRYETERAYLPTGEGER